MSNSILSIEYTRSFSSNNKCRQCHTALSLNTLAVVDKLQCEVFHPACMIGLQNCPQGLAELKGIENVSKSDKHYLLILYKPEYENRSRDQLRIELKEQNLSVHGLKQELVDRLDASYLSKNRSFVS